MYPNIDSSINSEKGYFILNHTWNLLYYIFRILGVYPCVRDQENNKLIPRSTFCIWMQFIFTSLVIFVIFMAIPTIYIANFETTPDNFLDITKKHFLSSSVNSFVMICNLILYFSIFWLCQLQLRKLVIGLCEFQTYCSKYAHLVDKKEIRRKLTMPKLCMLLYIILAISATILFNCDWFFELDISLASTVVLIFGNTIPIAHGTLPMYYFQLISMPYFKDHEEVPLKCIFRLIRFFFLHALFSFY